MQDMTAELEGLSAADLEALDPHPDVHALFNFYNQLYFDGCLGACSVEWSTKRMTLCAGVCHFQRGGGCRIKLSEPLLKYRPVKDLKETLLHEMIHAELFLKGVRDDGDHGPKFRARMEAINKATFLDTQRPAEGYNITVYHTMHDEVNLYRTHVWCCNRCGNTVKRSMNRPPQEADCRAYSKAAAAAAAAAGAAAGSYCRDERCWYHSHVRLCGGQYGKVQEPDKQQPTVSGKATSSSSSGSSKRLKQPTSAAGARPIEAFFKPDRQKLQQQQQQEDSQWQLDTAGKLPPPQQHQAGLQDGVQSSHQQQGQPPQPAQDYWQALGEGRLLVGSSCAGTTAAGVGKLASIPNKQQLWQQPATELGQGQAQGQHQHVKGPVKQEGRQPRQMLSLQEMQLNTHDIVELLSSDDEDSVEGSVGVAGGEGTWHASAAAVSTRGTMHAAAVSSMGNVHAAVDAADSHTGTTRGHVAAVAAELGEGNVHVAAERVAIACPVCCQEWVPGEISNDQLNLHLDACLARMHC